MEYKYRILYYLNQLDPADKALSLDKLPEWLGVSKETFKKWTYLPKDDYYEIPLLHALRLAQWLQIDLLQLYTNIPIDLTKKHQLCSPLPINQKQA
jgi:hypothetical protein